MQRQIVDSVPYFVDGQNRLYTWDSEAAPQHIGTYNPNDKSVQFNHNHLGQLGNRLSAWRDQQKPRDRKPTATAASKRRGAGNEQAASAENSEDDS